MGLLPALCTAMFTVLRYPRWAMYGVIRHTYQQNRERDRDRERERGREGQRETE